MVIYVVKDKKPKKQTLDSDQLQKLQEAMDKLFISVMLWKERVDGQQQQQTHERTTKKKVVSKSVCVYGSVSYDGYNKGKAGFGVYWNNGEYKNTSFCLGGSGVTHNIALLRAVGYAVRQDLEGRGELKIFTNNSYVINTLTKWHKRWRRNNWTLMTGEKPKNLELIQEVLSFIRNRVGNVTFHMVHWHDDYPPLSEARDLARHAMRKDM